MKIHEKEETLKQRLQHLEAIEKEKEELQNAHAKRFNFAKDLRQEIAVRAAEREKLKKVILIEWQAEKEANTNHSDDIRKELQEKAKHDKENKVKEALEIDRTLIGQINEKKVPLF